MFAQPYSNLYLCSLNQEQHDRTCGYWYTITSNATAHTAFRRKSALLNWMALRGLEVEGEIPEPGTWGSFRIKGSYRTAMHSSYDAFYALDGIETKGLSNGSYTMMIITTDEDGVRTVHSLNPNCRHRPVYDYRTTELEYA